MTDTVVAEDKESDTSSGAALGAIIYIYYIYIILIAQVSVQLGKYFKSMLF